MPKFEIEILDKNTFKGFKNFTFNVPSSRRKVFLSDVLPINQGLEYCALISEACSNSFENQQCINDFYGLFKLLKLPEGIDSFVQLRNKVGLIEGRKIINADIIKLIKETSKNSKDVFIQCSTGDEEFCWKMNLDKFFSQDDLICDLPSSFGEYSVSDNLNTWFLKFRDDDSFFFLAAPKELIEKICSQLGKYALRVPGDIIF